MQQYKNVTLIGTSHIAQQSIDEIKHIIETWNPEIIAIELDKGRFKSLFERKRKGPSIKNIGVIGFKGYLFALIGGYLQKKMGRLVNVEPGAEMRTAASLAKKHSIKLALIDQKIEITLKRFSQEFGWKEKWQLLKDIFFGVFSKEKIDLTKVPQKDLIKRFLDEIKQNYPGIYKSLIFERNKVMANNIHQILQENPDQKLLIVIGAGHEDAIFESVKKNI